MPDINATLTQTVISATVTNPADVVASLGQTLISATLEDGIDINGSISSSPIAATLVNGGTITATVTESPIEATVTNGLADAPSDGTTYGRKDGGWVAVSSGVTDHAALSNLDYASAGHTGFQATLTADVDYLTPGTATSTYQPIGSYLTDAPSDGSTYGRNNGAWTAVSSGVTNHAALSNLDYASAGHTGFQSALSFPLTPDLGGTGIANAAGSTLTLGGATTISTGGTLALGGYTLTVPATGTAALLATANVFTGINTTKELRISGGVSTFVSDTAQLYLDASWGLTITGKAGTKSDLGFFAADGTLLFRNVAGTENFLFSESGNGRVGIKVVPQTTLHVAGEIWEIANNARFVIGQAVTVGNYGYLQWNNTATAIYLATQAGGVGLKLYNNGNINIGETGGLITIARDNTTTGAVVETVRIQSAVSTASTGGAAGFGPGQSFYAETATDGTNQQQGLISTSWIDATNVSRKAKMSLSAYDTAARLGLEIEADGSAAKIALYGVATVLRATTGVAEAAFTENAGGAVVNVDSTFGGYTLQQIAQALQDIGLLT